MNSFREKTRIPSTTILGVRVSRVAKREALVWITEWITKGERKMVVTPNPEQVMMAQRDGSFRQILNRADLALADGVGLVWGSRVLYLRHKTKDLRPIAERVTGEDVMQELVCLAAKHGWKVFLLGGRPGVARRAAELLRIKNHELSIMGSSGTQDIRNETEEERKSIIAKINRFKPDLLFVAYGAPWQEKWLARNLGRLDVKVAMVVGGGLDMIVDPSLRPPDLMTKLGLDWLYRLVRQPWRIKRQMALVRFVWLVLVSRISGK